MNRDRLSGCWVSTRILVLVKQNRCYLLYLWSSGNLLLATQRLDQSLSNILALRPSMNASQSYRGIWNGIYRETQKRKKKKYCFRYPVFTSWNSALKILICRHIFQGRKLGKLSRIPCWMRSNYWMSKLMKVNTVLLTLRTHGLGWMLNIYWDVYRGRMLWLKIVWLLLE